MMDEQVVKVLRELEEFRKKRDDLYNLPREAARFLHILVKAAGIKNALEVGTSNGYSGIWIVSALKETGGHLATIEISKEKVAMAQKNFESAGLSTLVEILNGEAEKILPGLQGPFDLVFFDADKQPQLGYLQEIYPRIVPGGVIVSDNVHTHPQELANYLSYVRRHPEMDSITVPLGNGLELSYKRR
ncbi:MAG: O-methyltransferase [Chloroflexi bacterium]|nr:O-methyltransferase [Chloroflexota bacterium]